MGQRMPSINWRKVWSYLAGLVFLCLIIKDPAEAKELMVWLWHAFSTTFGWIFTEAFQALVNLLNSKFG